MRTIKLTNEDIDLEIEINVKDSWNDVYLDEYLRLTTLYQKQSNMETEEFLLKLITIISDAKEDDIKQLSVNELNKLTDIVQVFSNFNTEFKDDYILIDGQIYVPKKNMSNISMEEMTFYKNFEKSEDLSEKLISLLVLLVRPGYEKDKDGKIRYIQHRFNMEDVEERKELFKKKLKASVAIPLISSFMNGMSV